MRGKTGIVGDAVARRRTCSVSATLDYWCGGSNLREEWIFDSPVYQAEDIELKLLIRHHQEDFLLLFVGWHNVEVLFIVRPFAVNCFCWFPAGRRVMTRRSYFFAYFICDLLPYGRVHELPRW